MKIIIAGDGKVGSTLTRELAAEGYDVTIIDANPKVLEATEERYDVLSIQGNCASMDVLDQAGVREADLLIVATSADEINLLCSLTAHCMNKNIHTMAKGMKTILLTGGNGGSCRNIADISICVPEQETFKIQELHLPIYHAVCAMVEDELFVEK